MHQVDTTEKGEEIHTQKKQNYTKYFIWLKCNNNLMEYNFFTPYRELLACICQTTCKITDYFVNVLLLIICIYLGLRKLSCTFVYKQVFQ